MTELPNAKPRDYLAEAMTAQACGFMKKNGEHPFLLHLSYYLVHQNLMAYIMSGGNPGHKIYGKVKK